jgi:hypothetical protein
MSNGNSIDESNPCAVHVDNNEESADDEIFIINNEDYNNEMGENLKGIHQFIALFYVNALGSPPRKEWKRGVDMIVDVFKMTKYQHRKVYKIFQYCKAAKEKEELYDGSQISYYREKTCYW